jgi:amidase
VADTALLLAAISGPDPRVPMALDSPPPPLTDPAQVAGLLRQDLAGLRIGWSDDLGLPVDADVRGVLAGARQVLAGLGAVLVTAAPDLSGGDEIFRTWRAFRFVTSLGPLLRERPDAVGANVRWNIQRGAELTTADLSRATLLRAELTERVSAFFGEFDLLACPVSQVTPFAVELDWVHEIDGVPQQNYLDWMASSYLISVTGLPAISVPAGFTAAGLPVGLQLVGARRSDWDLLGVARAFEAATGYGRVVPALS